MPQISEINTKLLIIRLPVTHGQLIEVVKVTAISLCVTGTSGFQLTKVDIKNKNNLLNHSAPGHF